MTRIHWEKEDRIELEKSFALNPHPDSAKKQMIADKLRVKIEKIDNFFKNKRQKLRRSGIAIKRVFHEESPARFNKSRRVKTMSPSANHTKSALATVKLEYTSTPPALITQKTPVINIEKDDDPDYYPDMRIEHQKNLDQILEQNLNQLNESEDTGIEGVLNAKKSVREIKIYLENKIVLYLL